MDEVPTRKRPPFTRDQMVSPADVQRKWRLNIEPRLREYPYILVVSGSEPRTTVMPYEGFEHLWQQAEEAAELDLKLEVLSRALAMVSGQQPLISFAELCEKLGVTAEDLKAAGDVEIETD